MGAGSPVGAAATVAGVGGATVWTAAVCDPVVVDWVHERIPNPSAMEAAMMRATARIVIDEMVRWGVRVRVSVMSSPFESCVSTGITIVFSAAAHIGHMPMPSSRCGPCGTGA
jgi:hypothetical protein